MEAPSAAAGATSSRYEILARLATGGMAELYLARATAADGVVTHVVLKRILPSRSHDPQFVTMFLDEAALAAQLHHPNIAQVFDIGRLGSSYFFTMEYVHGENARAVLQREYGLRRKVPIGHAITVAAGAATGLHHAHEATGADRRPLGIVHRDVSPANIMISFDGAVKLVDFGVAKAAVRFHETRAGTIKGKIAYLSPEQCTGNKPVDRRSDVFSLGIVLHELLTVQRLFRRDSDFATMAAIVTDDVPPPSRLRREVPPELDDVVMTALAKDPEARYPTAGAMVDALEQAATRGGIALSVGGLGRYLREMFGVRPEPWIELESLEQHPAPVTVTGESMIQIPTMATSLGPVATMLPSGQNLAPPPPVVGEVAEIEAALVRTVRLEAVAQPDDDDFLASPASSRPDAAEPRMPRGKDKEHTEALEDRPTVIDDHMPEMPTDLDETTPIETMDPVVTPPSAIAALSRSGTTSGPPPAPPVRPTPGSLPPPVPPKTASGTPPLTPVTAPLYLAPTPGIPQHTPPLQAVQHTPPLQPSAPALVPAPPILPPRAAGAFPQPPGIGDHDDHEETWTRDTQLEAPAAGAEAATMRRDPAAPGPAMMPQGAAPYPYPPAGAVMPPAAVPKFRLSTKLIVAGVGIIIAALIIRAATHPTPKVDPAAATDSSPGLPPVGSDSP